MTMLAVKECDDKDLLPEKYKNMLDDKDDLKKALIFSHT
jgi:hypothetical protein